jgi:hypothetical protein
VTEHDVYVKSGHKYTSKRVCDAVVAVHRQLRVGQIWDGWRKLVAPMARRQAKKQVPDQRRLKQRLEAGA